VVVRQMFYNLSHASSPHLVLSIFKYPLWFLQWATDYSKVYCSVSMYFYSFSCYWYLILFHYGLVRYEKLSIFLYLLIVVLWPKIWPILEQIPWTAEKNVYSAASGWSIVSVPAKCIWSIVQFNSEVSWLNFFFLVWMKPLMIRMGYWSRSLLLYLDLFLYIK
jgi:hypothetical protein